MQLKTIDESLNVTKTINQVINANNHLGNRLLDDVVLAQKIGVATKGYSTETVKSAIARSNLNEVQIKAILYQQGLKGETLETTTAELAQVTSTNALSASQNKATTSTMGFGNAMKELGDSIKSFALANPILTDLLAVAGEFLVYLKIYDALAVSEEEMAETHEKSKDALEESKKRILIPQMN